MAGRTIPAPAFPDDDGTADTALQRALDVCARDPAREPEVLAALSQARVLVPVVAVRAETDPPDPGDPPGAAVREKRTDMAVAIAQGTDGRRALPVFSSVATLSRWDPAARPVPVPARHAAIAAAQERAELLVLDLAGPTTVVVPWEGLRRLGQGGSLRPLYDDPRVRAELSAGLQRVEGVRAAWLGPAAGRDGRLSVELRDLAGARRVGTELARLVAAADSVRGSVLRGLDVAVLPPGGGLAEAPFLSFPG